MEWLRIWVAKFEFSWETYKSPTLLYTCPGPPLVYGYFQCSAGLMPHPPMYGKAERSICIVSISPARGVSSTQCVPYRPVHHWTVSCKERVRKQGISKPFDCTGSMFTKVCLHSDKNWVLCLLLYTCKDNILIS